LKEILWEGLFAPIQRSRFPLTEPSRHKAAPTSKSIQGSHTSLLCGSGVRGRWRSRWLKRRVDLGDRAIERRLFLCVILHDRLAIRKIDRLAILDGHRRRCSWPRGGPGQRGGRRSCCRQWCGRARLLRDRRWRRYSSRQRTPRRQPDANDHQRCRDQEENTPNHGRSAWSRGLLSPARNDPIEIGFAPRGGRFEWHFSCAVVALVFARLRDSESNPDCSNPSGAETGSLCGLARSHFSRTAPNVGVGAPDYRRAGEPDAHGRDGQRNDWTRRHRATRRVVVWRQRVRDLLRGRNRHDGAGRNLCFTRTRGRQSGRRRGISASWHRDRVGFWPTRNGDHGGVEHAARTLRPATGSSGDRATLFSPDRWLDRSGAHLSRAATIRRGDGTPLGADGHHARRRRAEYRTQLGLHLRTPRRACSWADRCWHFNVGLTHARRGDNFCVVAKRRPLARVGHSDGSRAFRSRGCER
jgi:hypothetical protein